MKFLLVEVLLDNVLLVIDFIITVISANVDYFALASLLGLDFHGYDKLLLVTCERSSSYFRGYERNNSRLDFKFRVSSRTFRRSSDV